MNKGAPRTTTRHQTEGNPASLVGHLQPKAIALAQTLLIALIQTLLTGLGARNLPTTTTTPRDWVAAANAFLDPPANPTTRQRTTSSRPAQPRHRPGKARHSGSFLKKRTKKLSAFIESG